MQKLIRQFLSALPKWWQQHLLPLIVTIRAVGLIAAALSIWLFSEIAEEILDKETFAFDKEILLILRDLHTPFLDQVMLGFTFVGEPMVLLVVCLVLGIWLLVQKKFSKATTLVIAALGATALNYWLKTLFGRDRPLLWERVVDVNQYSFPSGHAMISLVILGIIGYLLASEFPQWRGWTISITIALIGGIGLSRLYLGVHWPTDVAAGYAAGIVWLVACIFSSQIWRELRSTASKPPGIEE